MFQVSVIRNTEGPICNNYAPSKTCSTIPLFYGMYVHYLDILSECSLKIANSVALRMIWILVRITG